MTRTLNLLTAAALMTGLVGCVSQEKYNALKLERDALSEQLGTAQKDASAARAEAEVAKQNLAAIASRGGDFQGLIANLTTQNANLQAQIEEWSRRYGDAIRNAGGPLPASLSNALTEWANANPDLVDFDAARGIVKFKSDVTFATGDAALQPKAKEVINRFAQILNSPAASGYELLVAGHTDNQRVSNPRTIQNGHKDNWYLSAHRAISVGSELLSQGTNAQRIGVVGYADNRPVAPNTSESGRQQNRRVEVLILPSTVRNTNTGTAARPATPRPTLNKDGGGSANAPTGSALNK